MFSNNLALYLKDLKSLLLAISILKLVASSFEYKAVVPLIFVIYLMDGESLKSQRLDFKFFVL